MDKSKPEGRQKLFKNEGKDQEVNITFAKKKCKKGKKNFCKTISLQLISYKRYFECTLVQWILSIYP